MFDVLQAPTDLPEAPPPAPVAPEDLVDELAAVLSHRDRIEARAVSLLAGVGATGAYEYDGYHSPTAMLKHRMSLHPGEAHRLVQRANGLANAPLTSVAYERGAISGAQVDVLLEARSIAPEAFTEEEGSLVAMALDTPMVRDLKKRLEYWLEQVEADELAYGRVLVRDTRSLTLRRDGEMIRISGWVDIETGEQLGAALEPGPPALEDTRSTPARRADLLIDIVNGATDRPHLIVHLSAERLAGRPQGRSETSNGTFLTTGEVDRLACDANLTRVILNPESRPLDVGRTKRLVTPGLKCAVTARDLGCVFPRCDQISPRCDVHHIVPWAKGGSTAIENLVLLCRHHHTLVHEGGWTLTGTPGRFAFLRPDGTELGTDRRTDGRYISPIHEIPASSRPSIDMRSAIRQIKAINYPRGPD